MKKKILGGLAVLAIAMAVAFNVHLVHNKTFNVSKLVLASVEILASAEPGDLNGGTLPAVNITCSTGGYGTCYYVSVEEGMFGACRFDCTASGDPNDSCSEIWVDLINFCSAMSQG